MAEIYRIENAPGIVSVAVFHTPVGGLVRALGIETDEWDIMFASISQPADGGAASGRASIGLFLVVLRCFGVAGP